ncbi:uncharacterized protein LOC134748091 [Cydia strobilella]|uniref:uncharacterized protein LOC134748091 n=1 Tax=Cydia strobilella TaxID=1100964 RepID=UPI0030070C9C
MSLLLSMLGLSHRCRRHRRLEAKITLVPFIMGLGLLFPRLKEQDLLAMTPDELFTASPMAIYLPWTQRAESNVGSIKFDIETFQVNLDVPVDSVKAPDGFIVIQLEETKQASYSSSQFSSEYAEGCNSEGELRLRLSSEGVPVIVRAAPNEMPVSIFKRGSVRREIEEAWGNLDDR